jgi:hypothetical protein
METDIINQAGRYAELARMLLDADIKARQDEGVGADIHEALLRLYYAKKLEADMEACQTLLTEDTEEETVTAVEEAAQTVREASDATFDLVEVYSAAYSDFAAKIENLKLDSAEEKVDDLLCKLYKCEGIIRMAYRCATRFPTYGIPSSILGGEPDTEPVADPEEYIADDMDVDIFALLDARDALIAKIGPLAEQP